MDIQITITIPDTWKDELEHMARIYSIECDDAFTCTELIKKAIQEKYNLDDEEI